MVDRAQHESGGKRVTFESGMVRDSADGRVQYWRILDGPMFDRWAEHLTASSSRYPDVALGRANWTLANSEYEYQRFKESAFRHFIAWYRGQKDEDHAAAVFFNINGAEYVREKLEGGI